MTPRRAHVFRNILGCGGAFGGLVALAGGCLSSPSSSEQISQAKADVDTICNQSPAASIDGIPAYPYCGNTDVWSNNGVDTQSFSGGAGWVRTEGGFGYQCFELASRYMYFKWGVSPSWGVTYASEMCNTHPAGVSLTSNPVHGDLAVFAGGSCGVAAPAGHVAVVDTVGASTFTAVQQNVATSITWNYGCASCFLHADSNTGSSDPCSGSNVTGYNCGASSQFPGGTMGTLYYCVGGATQSTTVCPNGCSVQPPGVSDKCSDPPPPPPPPPPALVYPKILRKTPVDVNGDGRADVCGRAVAGVFCEISNGAGFPTEVKGPELSDAAGWNHPEYESTIQFADIDGDGKADICGRDSSGITCSLSSGTAFGPLIAGPAWADASGWNRPEYYSTIQFADVNGDGKADVCARDSGGIVCTLATGDGHFGASIRGPDWSDAKGFNKPEYYSVIQFADINGDGKADVCGRDPMGIVCAISDGTGFTQIVRGPAWSDAGNWNQPEYASTIRFVDIDGDGKADVCGRSSSGVVCSLSTGSGFGPELQGPGWNDAGGWNKPEYYSTIQFADVNGDGKADICARAPKGVFCEISDGHGFPTEVQGPAWGDAQGFNQPQFYATLGTADVNHDGLDDLCMRTSTGVLCALSTGKGFDAPIAGPGWNDANGWGNAPYYASVRYVGAAHVPATPIAPPDGTVQPSVPVDPDPSTATPPSSASPPGSASATGWTGSCSTAPLMPRSPNAPSLVAVAIALIAVRRRRRTARD